MSDSEGSDDLELREIIAEYAAKEKEAEDKINQQTKYKAIKECNVQGVAVADMNVPMDKVIFGDKSKFVRNLAAAVSRDADDYDVVAIEEKKRRKRKAAWVDVDDEVLKVGDVKRETKHTGPLDHLRKDKSYKEFLTTRFTRIVSQPKWASLDAKPENDDSDDEVLRTAGLLRKPSNKTLPSGKIQVKRLRDLNRATYAEGPITSIQFHPKSTAAVVAGEQGYATIYSVDGFKNEKLHSIHFRNFPLKCMKVTPCGTKAVFGSIRNHYYVYDLLRAHETQYMVDPTETMQNFEISPCGRYMAVAGRFGLLNLYDFIAQEIVHDFHQEHAITGLCFTSDSQRIICNSVAHEVSIYSLRQRKLEHMIIDDGCISGATLDLSPNQQMLATGSKEGVVNVYDFEKVFNSKSPQPEKRFFNLTTPITKVKFNHTSEILAMCSKEVPGAVKLAHFPSATVFSNFPEYKTDVGNIGTIEFSPSSGYLALGNRRREARLLRLKHYMGY